MPVKTDFRTMLPSQAKREVTALLLERFEKAALNSYANPMFDYALALREFDGSLHDWVRHNILHDCFKEALREYERRHPKDMEGGKVFRKGLGFPAENARSTPLRFLDRESDARPMDDTDVWSGDD